MKKKKIFLIIIPVVLGLVILLVLTKLFLPGLLVNLSMLDLQKKAGLSAKNIRIDNHKIYYYEGGEGENLVLIHGFSANKNNWIWMARYLTDKYHLIIPDLPGFGNSSRIADEDYGYDSQVKRLNDFFNALKIEKFHMAGNSMGGHISAIYAITYPEKVLSLGLIDSGGVISPEKSDYLKALEKGNNPFNIKSVGDYDIFMDYVFTTKPKVPKFIKAYFFKESKKYNDFNQYISGQISKNPYLLEPHLYKINIPVLILWGEDDRIIHVSAAKVFESGLKNHKTVIIKKCGHAPMVEKPQETAEYYLDFLENIK